MYLKQPLHYKKNRFNAKSYRSSPCIDLVSNRYIAIASDEPTNKFSKKHLI